MPNMNFKNKTYATQKQTPKQTQSKHDNKANATATYKLNHKQRQIQRNNKSKSKTTLKKTAYTSNLQSFQQVVGHTV